MAKSKNENCKLRHNTFEIEKDLSIHIYKKIMLGAAKECLRRIAPFFFFFKPSAAMCCFALKSHSMWKLGLWERYVAWFLKLGCSHIEREIEIAYDTVVIKSMLY